MRSGRIQLGPPAVALLAAVLTAVQLAQAQQVRDTKRSMVGVPLAYKESVGIAARPSCTNRFASIGCGTESSDICIPDDGCTTHAFRITGAPSCSRVTSVHYAIKIEGAGESCPGANLWVADVSAELRNAQGTSFVFWDRCEAPSGQSPSDSCSQGGCGQADNDCDDDSLDDRDVELDRAITSAFENDAVNQVWTVEVCDHDAGDRGRLECFELWVCYQQDFCGDGFCSACEDACSCSSDCPGCCTSEDCDDSDACTDDSCVDGKCEFSNNSGTCGNGIFCDGLESCINGLCESGELPCQPTEACDEEGRQ